jgi:hypothetical protein
VTDDDLLLTNALEEVLAVCEPKGENEAAWVAEVANKLIVEAYEQGMRDPATLAQYALRTIRQGRSNSVQFEASKLIDEAVREGSLPNGGQLTCVKCVPTSRTRTPRTAALVHFERMGFA